MEAPSENLTVRPGELEGADGERDRREAAEDLGHMNDHLLRQALWPVRSAQRSGA